MSATGYIDIKSRTGQLLASVIITQEAEVVEELMQSDYVELSWKSDASTPLPPGAYIEVGGERYRLLDGYTPDQASDAYTYTPQFHSRVAAWSKVPFFFYTFNAANEVIAREPEWTLTDTPANFMSQIIRAIKIETGETWTAVVDSTLSGTQTVQFGATDIFSSLNSVAGIFNTEWRADKATNTLYLGKAMHGTAITLTVGDNIQTPSVTNNRAGYYNRFYVFGSTRNVTQDYQGASVNNLVSKRLTLDPVKYPGGYIDIEDNLQPSQVMQKILTFDDVYPRAHLELPETGLRARLMYRLDEGTGNPKVIGTTAAGDPIYDQYVIWYIRPVVSDTGLELSFNGNTYDPVDCPDGMLIKGKTLSVHFNSGALTGREFELAYHDKNETLQNSDGTPFEVHAGDFEILFQEEGGLILPTGAESGIAPQAGDTLTLFNCRMPAEYTASAYIELEDAAEKEIAERYTADTNNYQFSSNPVAFKDADPGLTIGRAVHYVNGDYAYDTRVIKIVRKLDLPYEQTITVGNDRIKRNSETIKEEVTNANRNIDVLSALNNLTKNIQDGYGRAQQAMIEGFNRISRMWQFDPDDPQSIFSQYNVYSKKAIAGKGATAPDGSTGGGSLFGLMREWPAADPGSTTDDALGANLGWELRNKITALEGANFATQDWVLGKNYLTGLTKSMVEAVLTGNITSHSHSQYLTSSSLHSLTVKRNGTTVGTYKPDADATINISDVASAATLSAHIGSVASHITPDERAKWNKVVSDFAAITGSDSDTIINKWEEVVAFLDTYTEADTLANLLGNKADKTTTDALAATLTTKLDTTTFNDFKALFDSMFERESDGKGGYVIHAKYGLYTNDFLAGKGITPAAGSTGGGGGGSLFGLYTDTTWVSTPAESDALSAVLGKSLHARVSVLEGAGYLTGITKAMVENVLTGDITTHTHRSLSKPADNRSVATAPNDYNGKFFFTGMKSRTTLGVPGSSLYVNGFGWRGWDDSSGGKAWEVFGDNADLYVRCGSTTTWEAWRKILTDGNYASTLDARYARQAAPNNFMHSGNEMTFVPSGYSFPIWFNYQTVGGTNGAITEYRFGNGSGGAYADVRAKRFLVNGGTAAQFLMADGSVTTKVVASAVANTGWQNNAVDDLKVPTMSFLAYWNGAHTNGGSSNLQYCDRGRFGTMAVANAADYLARSGGSMTNTNLVNNLNANYLGGYTHEQIRRNALGFTPTVVPTSSGNCDLDLLKDGMARNYWAPEKWVHAPEGFGYGAAVVFAPFGYTNLHGQLAWDVNHAQDNVTRNLYWRVFATATGGTDKWGGWRQIAFTDGTIANATNAVNADIANKLRINNSTQENCLQYMQNNTGWNAWDAPSQTYYHVIKMNHGNGDTYYNRTLAFSFFDDRIYAGRLHSGSFKGWKTLAFLDDNVASATKLQTARSIWGQSFDGTSAITGNMIHVGEFRFEAGTAVLHNATTKVYQLWAVNGINLFPTWSVNTAAISVTPNGRVGVNMFSPAYDFDVTGVIHASGEIFSDKAIGGKGMTSSSDIRQKHIIGDFVMSLDDVLKMPLKRFKWLDGPDKDERIGVIAQEALKIVPQVVYIKPDGFYGVDYGALAHAEAKTAVRELVEQRTIIAKQGRQIKKLEKLVQKLQQKIHA